MTDKELEAKCLLDALKRKDMRAVKAIVTLALLSPIKEIQNDR